MYLSKSNHVTKHVHVLHTHDCKKSYIVYLLEALNKKVGHSNVSVSGRCSGSISSVTADTVILALSDYWAKDETTVYKDSYVGSAIKNLIANLKPTQSVYLAYPDSVHECSRVYGVYRLQLIDGVFTGISDRVVDEEPLFHIVTNGEGSEERRLLLAR